MGYIYIMLLTLTPAIIASAIYIAGHYTIQAIKRGIKR